MRLWDTVLDHGVNATRAGIAILKLLSLTVFSDRRCTVDDCEYIVPEGTPLCVHFTECHTTLESNHTPDNLADLIINLSPEHFSENSSACISFYMFVTVMLVLSLVYMLSATTFVFIRVASLSLTG